MRTASEICKCEEVESGLGQTKPLKLQRPFGRRITESGDADAARKPPFDGGLDQSRRDECHRYRHVDLTNAALLPRVADFESLRAAGKIRAWGVSNFKVSDMEDLFRVPHGDRCATNQVLYNVGSRDIEHDLLPWCEQHSLPVMAYSPLGGPGANLLRDPTLARIGEAHGCSSAAIALAWTIRNGNVIAIPESGLATHVKENAVALSMTLTPQELQTIEAAHPPPNRYVLGLKYWTRRVLRALSRPGGE